MQDAALIFVAFGAALAGAGILTSLLQFFADGRQVPTREKLAALSAEERKQRGKQISIKFAGCFFAIIMLFTCAWRIGSTP